jgi:T5SS/PEP-CTERM-associated repeat protein
MRSPVFPSAGRTPAVLAAAVAATLMGSVASAQSFTSNATPQFDLAVDRSIRFDADRGATTTTGGGNPREATVAWNAPTSGNWGTGSSWIGGVAPVAADTLQFGGTGIQTYTATNNTALAYGPVQLIHSGTGIVNLAGGFSSTNFRIDQGNAALGAGTHTFTNLASVGIASTATNADMSFTVGNVAGNAAVTFTGSTVNARNGYIGNHTDTTAVGTFNGGTYNFLPTNLLTGVDGGRFGTNLGNATLNVQGGAVINSFLFEVGRNPGARSTVNLSGAGTVLNSNQMAMSRNGAGAATVNVSNGAVLDIRYRTNDGTPNGIVNTFGNIFARSGEANDPATETAAINVTSGGKVFNRGNTLIAAATNAIGEDVPSNGSLLVSGAGSEYRIIQSPVVLQGTAPNTFTTVGGQLLLSDGVVGGPASGTATVSNGGLLAIHSMFTASNTGDTANITVTGAGSRMEIISFASISGGGGTNVAGGNTTINITAGGTVTAGDFFIANNGINAAGTGSRATVTVTGAGSSLTITDDAGTVSNGRLDVGSSGFAQGTLNVENGGTVSTNGGFTIVGATTGGNSTIKVEGVGSSLTGTGVLSVGGGFVTGDPATPVNAGTGTVNVVSGGTVTYGDVQFASSPNGVGNLTVSGTGSKLTSLFTTGDTGDYLAGTAAGTNATTVIGTGATLDVGGEVVLGGNATATSTVNISGTLIARGLGTNSTTAVTAGTVNVNVNAGGLITGGGQINMPSPAVVSVNTGGRVAPGNAGAGTLTVRGGGATFASGSTLELELASTSSFDKLVVGGAVTAGGSLDLRLLPGFSAVPTDNFQVVTGSSVSGTFGTLNNWGLVTVNGGGAAFGVTYSATDVVLTNFVRAGDVDRSGAVNNQDIAPFVALLTGGSPTGAVGFAADVDGNGVVNNQDIAPFVALLTGGRPLADVAGDPEFAPLIALVPEPGTLGLLAAAGVLGLRRRRSA